MTQPFRKSVALPEGAVSYLEWEGGGPTLLFAHANGFNGQTYRALLQPLAERFRIVASDARGHGFSTLPTTPGLARRWTIFRDDLLRFLASFGGGPKILAGHSMGATASIMAAALKPENVRALVLVEPVMVPTIPEIALRLMRAIGMKSPVPDMAERAEKRRDVFSSFDAALAAYTGRGAFKSWPAETVRDYLAGGLIPTGNATEMRLACAPAWEAEDFREPPLGIARLGRFIKCPVTLIHGGRGSTCRDQDVRAFARAHGNTRVIKLADASHFLPMEFPDVVREEIAKIA